MLIFYYFYDIIIIIKYNPVGARRNILFFSFLSLCLADAIIACNWGLEKKYFVENYVTQHKLYTVSAEIYLFSCIMEHSIAQIWSAIPMYSESECLKRIQKLLSLKFERCWRSEGRCSARKNFWLNTSVIEKHYSKEDKRISITEQNRKKKVVI